MHSSRLVAITLGLNLLLAGALVRPYLRPSAAVAPVGAARELTNRSLRLDPQGSLADARRSNLDPSVLAVVKEPFRWSELESEDYRVYVARLRGVGCPEATVQDIIIPDVNELFYQRVKELVDTVQSRFWEILADKREFEKMIDEKHGELRNLDEERDTVLKELLGPRASHRLRWDEQAALEQREARKQFLDFLPSEKVQECLAMEERFRVLREQFTSARPPLAAKDLQAGFQSLQTRQDSEFEAMLSVGELAEHKLRGSRFAYGRFEVGLAFTEEEMRGIVRIQEKFGATPTGTSSANSPGAQMPEGQKQQREELQQLLGAERVAQYDRVQDNRYQEFYRVADRFQLPAGVAAEGYEIRIAAEALAGQVRLDATISEEQRSAQLSAIRAETERSLADAYGPPAFKIYQTRSGQWLARLDGARANDR